MLVEYSHNNSGGNWWLKDEDWFALEANGWTVDWFKDQKDSYFGPRDRFLGALASKASKEFPTIDDAIEEWENITGQSSDDLGCSCCGQPHYFGEKY